jgi:hypothetical protein
MQFLKKSHEGVRVLICLTKLYQWVFWALEKYLSIFIELIPKDKDSSSPNGPLNLSCIRVYISYLISLLLMTTYLNSQFCHS